MLGEWLCINIAQAIVFFGVFFYSAVTLMFRIEDVMIFSTREKGPDTAVRLHQKQCNNSECAGPQYTHLTLTPRWHYFSECHIEDGAM